MTKVQKLGFKIRKFGRSTVNSIKNFDLFGDPVKITYKGKASHKTLLGGIVTVITCTLLLAYVSWRFYLFYTRDRDEYWTSLTVSEWEGVGSY